MTTSSLHVLRGLAERQNPAALKEACLHADPADPAVQVLLAFAHAQLGEPAAALAWAERARDGSGPLDEAARCDLAAVWLALDRVDEAAALLEALPPGGEADALRLARLGACRVRQGRTDEARALYAMSAERQPRVPVLWSLARLCLQQADAAAAQLALDQAGEVLREHRDWPEPLQRQAAHPLHALQLEVWAATGEDAPAEAWLEAMRAKAPDDWAALLSQHALALAQHNRHAQAEESLRAGLRHSPDNRLLIDPLIELAQLQGRNGEAAALLRRAIGLAKDQPAECVALWARLSSVWLHVAEETAQQAADKAATLVEALDANAHPPEVLRQARTLVRLAQASVASQKQDYARAQADFEALLADNPRLLPALQGLGHLKLQLGQIDDAVALFERMAAIDPAKGAAALINARRFPEDEASLLRIERFARLPSAEGTVRAGLLFQLAAAWESRKEHERAFALVREANAASRRFLHYDGQAHRDRCARIRHAFSRSLYESRPGVGVDSTLPVFVLGMPRSGTTLVEQVLAGHSQIHGAGELGIIPRVIQGLERWERFTGSGRHYPDCVDDLSPEVVTGIAETVLDELREIAPQARHVVDKLPHNFENIGLIKFLFPHAKIISVRRDPRDIAISNYFTDYQAKHGGMGFAYDLTDIGEQLADHHLLMQHWRDLFPGQIFEVQYEALVDDPETVARAMLDYVGVAWEPQVLQSHELQRPVKTASVWQVRQPVYQSAKARWQRYQQHLGPLFQGTNAKIRWTPIDNMIALPQPGLFDEGVRFYKLNELDQAEYRFQQVLHHIPDHAAANFMVGLVYVHKGHLQDGIALMEKGLERCPWNRNWRKDLARAHQLAGNEAQASRLAEPAACTDDPDEVSLDDPGMALQAANP